MTLAEKHYRATFKIKPDVKLTNDQWKIVNMMHRCLQENNKPKMPQGKMFVDTEQLKSHLRCIDKIIKDTDALMASSENAAISKSKFGKDLAAIINRANITNQSIKHFQLNIPLERVNDDI